MQRTYSIASARAKHAEIIDKIEAGDDVEIVRRGKKVAALMSPARYARMSSVKTAFGDAYDAFMKNHDPQTFGVEPGFFEQTSDRSPGRTVKL